MPLGLQVSLIRRSKVHKVFADKIRELNKIDPQYNVEINYINGEVCTYPSLGCVDGYFYLKPLEHVLSGFCCETVPGGIYIWRFIFPLFIVSDAIHLTYSARLRYPEGFISKEVIPKAEYAAEFLKRIEAHMCEASDSRTIEGYVRYYSDKSLEYFGYKVRKSYAYALILAGLYDEAKETINEIIVFLKKRGLDQKCVDECEEFLRLLSVDSRGVVELLLECDALMKKAVLV